MMARAIRPAEKAQEMRTLSQIVGRLDANPRFYDRLNAVCSVILGLATVAVFMLAIEHWNSSLKSSPTLNVAVPAAVEKPVAN